MISVALSAEQKRIHELLRNCGADVLVLDDIDDAVAAMEERSVIRCS